MIFDGNKKSLIAIAMSAFIARTQAQATCNSTSLDCCWVVRSWQLMGQSTTVSSSSSTECCNMLGVTCSDENNVTFIYWVDKRLSGSIPPELGNLTSLTVLDLSQNQLSGPIPMEIGNLPHLSSLSLNNNQLSLPIPPEIKKLDSLSFISLTGNKFEYSDIPADIRERITLKTESADNNRELFPEWPFQLGLGLGFGFLGLGILGVIVYKIRQKYHAKKRTAQGTDDYERKATNSDQPEILAIKSEQL